MEKIYKTLVGSKMHGLSTPDSDEEIVNNPSGYFFCISCMEYYPKTPDCEGYNTPDGIMCEQCEEERAKYFAGGRW